MSEMNKCLKPSMEISQSVLRGIGRTQTGAFNCDVFINLVSVAALLESWLQSVPLQP